MPLCVDLGGRRIIKKILERLALPGVVALEPLVEGTGADRALELAIVGIVQGLHLLVIILQLVVVGLLGRQLLRLDLQCLALLPAADKQPMQNYVRPPQVSRTQAEWRRYNAIRNPPRNCVERSMHRWCEDIEARNRKLGHINRLPTKPKRWIHGMPEMELWYDEHTTAEQRQNWREYYNKLVVTGQARSEPPNSWYEQQRAAAVQTEKQKLQQQFMSPPTRNSQPDSQPASQSTNQSASPLTGWTPTAATPDTVNMPATPDLVVQKDSQQTEIGTPDESNGEDSQNTQFQSQLDPDTPEELFSLL
eukprot:COSAG02_NODE_17306_length_1013_cov_1.144420_2_plen_306_part_00